MGKSCCVPNCFSNHGNSKEAYVSSFQFPKDPDRRRKWLTYISREKTFQITNNTVVCIKHFHQQFIVLFEEFKTKDGTIRIARDRPKLTDDAYPSIFPNQPSYRSSVPAKKRKDPQIREEEILELQKKQNEERDIIKNFQNFMAEVNKKDIKPLILKYFEDCATLIKIEDRDFLSPPSVTTLKISTDFNVRIFKDGAELNIEKLKFCLGDYLKCDRWSKFDKLITYFISSDVDDRSQVEKITSLSEKMNDVLNSDEESEDAEAEKKLVKFRFLVEQINLAVSTVIRYSPDMLVWAAFHCYTYPGAYKSLRDTNHLTLPHPKYLQKFLFKIGNNEPGIGASQTAFMKEKFKLLDDNDKVVAMMLDEIFVNQKVSYKGGKVYGIAEYSQNSSDITAGTMQAFMSRSMRSKNKDVVGLFPVRNLDGEMLKEMTLAALKHMHEVGFTVLCLVADNNKVNVKLYELLCGGELKTCISNPFDKSKPLFLLFDQVHLFKNNRNNWINAVAQILRIPYMPKLFDFSLYDSNRVDCSVSSICEAAASKTPAPMEVSTSQTSADVELIKVSTSQTSADVELMEVSTSQTPADVELMEVRTSQIPADCAKVVEVSKLLEPSADTEPPVEFIEARFSDLKDLFHAEAKSVVRLAPKLSRKAIFPSSVERQNVSLVTPIFHDTTIVALQTLKNDKAADISQGTIWYLQIWSRWWKVSNVKNPFKGRRLNDIWCTPVTSSDDMKIKFLEDLVFFLEVWEQSEESGKFTDQTHAAFLHTLKATIELCHYVFNDLKWAYILLGMLQTDNLEGQFGGYRRLSGCNFHISVEQILESERKLKLLGVLTLQSAKTGEFSLSSFAEGVSKSTAEIGEANDDKIEIFESAIFEMERIMLSLNERRVLLCLSSYAATKTIQQFAREKMEICDSCKSNLITDIPLEVESVDSVFDYLSGIDRGGLYRPADFTYDVCVNMFKLFQILISPKYEERFLKLKYQRRAIIKLGLSMYEKILEDMFSSCNTCGLRLNKVLKKCFGIFGNIFMNNYTKSLNESNTARQLADKLNKKEKKKAAAAAKAAASAKAAESTTGKEKKNSTDVRKILKLSSKGSS